MTELEQWKDKILTDDLIMCAFGFNEYEVEWSEELMFNHIIWVLDKAGVPDEHEDMEKIWDFVNDRACEVINNAVS